jgi:Protein of unknown function (DUF1656)
VRAIGSNLGNSAVLGGLCAMNLLAGELNRPEFRFLDLHSPWIAMIGLSGFMAAWLVVAIMEHTGLSNYVWHLPLFFAGQVLNAEVALKQQQQNLDRRTDLYRRHVTGQQDFQNAQDAFPAVESGADPEATDLQDSRT